WNRWNRNKGAHSVSSRTRWASMRRIALGALGGLALALSGVAAVPASSADAPGGDEIAKTANIRHLANVPKQGDFATEAAFGTDLAFKGKYAIAGNYEGFVIYDISRPDKPKIVSQVRCVGAQNDVSVA